MAAIIHLMPAQRTEKAGGKGWNWLLLVPLALLVYPGLYNRASPALAGFPFFYWYQFAVVIVTALLTGIVYWAQHGSHEGDEGK